jgi:sec-independent protein translocase protein TatA
MGFLNGLSGWHLLIILAIVVLLFGAAKLPALAKGVGQSVKIFRRELAPADDKDAEGAAKVDGATAPTATYADAEEKTEHEKPVHTA